MNRSKKAAVAELKAQLSRYLSRVKRGEEVVVTERGHPIAKLVPIPPGEDEEGERQRLAREGILELGTGGLDPRFLHPSPFKDPEGAALKALLEEREEGY